MKAGRQHDRVEIFASPIVEHDAVVRQAVDPAAYLDGAVPDPAERADIDQRDAAVFGDHLARSFGRAAQTETFHRAEREPQYRRVDEIDHTRRQLQTPVEDRPGQDRQTQQIARQDLNRAANRERDIDAGLRQIERDLAARIAKPHHQHPLAQIRRRIAVFAAMDDGPSIRSPNPARMDGVVRWPCLSRPPRWEPRPVLPPCPHTIACRRAAGARLPCQKRA